MAVRASTADQVPLNQRVLDEARVLNLSPDQSHAWRMQRAPWQLVPLSSADSSASVRWAAIQYDSLGTGMHWEPVPPQTWSDPDRAALALRPWRAPHAPPLPVVDVREIPVLQQAWQSAARQAHDLSHSTNLTVHPVFTPSRSFRAKKPEDTPGKRRGPSL